MLLPVEASVGIRSHWSLRRAAGSLSWNVRILTYCMSKKAGTADADEAERAEAEAAEDDEEEEVAVTKRDASIAPKSFRVAVLRMATSGPEERFTVGFVVRSLRRTRR